MAEDAGDFPVCSIKRKSGNRMIKPCCRLPLHDAMARCTAFNAQAPCKLSGVDVFVTAGAFHRCVLELDTPFRARAARLMAGEAIESAMHAEQGEWRLRVIEAERRVP